MNRYSASVLAAITGACLAAIPAQALQVNFSNSWVPAPGHGRLLLYPSFNTVGTELVQYQYLDVGVVGDLGLAVETTFLGSAGRAGFGNSAFYLNYRLGEVLPGLTGRIAPVAAIKTGDFGRSSIGMVGFFDWQISEALKLYTSPGYSFAPDGQASPHRGWLNLALDYRLLPWLSVDIEVLSGFPNWNFGPQTQLGLAPGATVYIGDMGIQASLRVPVVRSAASQSLEVPTLQLGWFIAW